MINRLLLSLGFFYLYISQMNLIFKNIGTVLHFQVSLTFIIKVLNKVCMPRFSIKHSHSFVYIISTKKNTPQEFLMGVLK
jgi:hypothetical protein